MSLVLSGPVLGVIEKNGVKDGRSWALRQVAIQHGLGSVFVTLSDKIEAPTQGEVVAYEVGAKVLQPREGKVETAALVWNAYALAPLPAMLKAS